MDPHKQRMRQSSVDCNWRTPPALIAQLRKSFYFNVDLAADADSSICRPDSTALGHTWLGPGSTLGEDALTVSWSGLQGYPCGFLNPPYSVSLISKIRSAGIVNGVQTIPGRMKDDPRIRALRIENWAKKAYEESLLGFTTVGVFPYAPQTKWFRRYVMGHLEVEREPGFPRVEWEHAALDYWRVPHRVTFLRADGRPAVNANVNTCIIHWGPNPGFVGPWVPSGRYWSYR